MQDPMTPVPIQPIAVDPGVASEITPRPYQMRL
jgi:hypothetical protein